MSQTQQTFCLPPPCRYSPAGEKGYSRQSVWFTCLLQVVSASEIDRIHSNTVSPQLCQTPCSQKRKTQDKSERESFLKHIGNVKYDTVIS